MCNKNRFCQSSRSCFARGGTLGLLCMWLLALRAMVLQLFLPGGWGFCSFKKFSGVDLKHVFISVFTPIYPSLRYQSISGVNTPPRATPMLQFLWWSIRSHVQNVTKIQSRCCENELSEIWSQQPLCSPGVVIIYTL